MILIPISLLFPLIILARKFLYLDDEDGHGGDVHGGEAELAVLKLGETNTGDDAEISKDEQPTENGGDLEGDVPGGGVPGGDHAEPVVLREQCKTTVGKQM